jgi:hypothetical protein
LLITAASSPDRIPRASNASSSSVCGVQTTRAHWIFSGSRRAPPPIPSHIQPVGRAGAIDALRPRRLLREEVDPVAPARRAPIIAGGFRRVPIGHVQRRNGRGGGSAAHWFTCLWRTGTYSLQGWVDVRIACCLSESTDGDACWCCRVYLPAVAARLAFRFGTASGCRCQASPGDWIHRRGRRPCKACLPWCER